MKGRWKEKERRGVGQKKQYRATPRDALVTP